MYRTHPQMLKLANQFIKCIRIFRGLSIRIEYLDHGNKRLSGYVRDRFHFSLKVVPLEIDCHRDTCKHTCHLNKGETQRVYIVLWQSEIFHPNLMLPEDGGSVCTKLLADWDFSNNLMGFIKGIEALLANPNPQSPWGTDSCTMAAQHFNAEEYDPPIERKKDTGPKVVKQKVREDEVEEEEEDEVDNWD